MHDVYTADRDDLLERIVVALQQDERCVAAWLAGSFGRGEADALSDLDLVVVVADHAAEALCRRGTLVHAGTTDERLALILQFGAPLSMHEHHGNAPPDGSFTNVVYADTAQVVDWILVPQSVAQRPPATQLLFDRVGIPLLGAAPVPVGAALAERLAERVAFFWMLLFPTAKTLLRGDAVRMQTQLEMVAQTRLDVADLLNGVVPGYRRDAVTSLLVSDAARVQTLHAEAQQMLQLHPLVEAAGGNVPTRPLETLAMLLPPLTPDRSTS